MVHRHWASVHTSIPGALLRILLRPSAHLIGQCTYCALPERGCLAQYRRMLRMPLQVMTLDIDEDEDYKVYTPQFLCVAML